VGPAQVAGRQPGQREGHASEGWGTARAQKLLPAGARSTIAPALPVRSSCTGNTQSEPRPSVWSLTEAKTAARVRRSAPRPAVASGGEHRTVIQELSMPLPAVPAGERCLRLERVQFFYRQPATVKEVVRAFRRLA
jgi:hypothetical protein